MPEAFVNAIINSLNSLIQKEIGLLWGFNKEMENLSSTLSTICAVLEDAEENQFKDRAIKNWLQKLGDVSYELKDILDECEMEEASRSDYRGQRSRLTPKGWNNNTTASMKKTTKAEQFVSWFRITCMFYLLLMKPAMLAPVLGNWHIVFQDTFAEAKRYLMKYSHLI